MRRSRALLGYRVLLLVAGLWLGGAEAIPAEPGHLVYRIDRESSYIRYTGDWNNGPHEEVLGRFRLHFNGDSAYFEDIDTAAIPRVYEGYLPSYPGLFSKLGSMWQIEGEDRQTGKFQVLFSRYWYESLELYGCDWSSSPYPWGNGFVIKAQAEPLVVSPLSPKAGEPFQALVAWDGYSDRPIAGSGFAVVDGSTVLVYGNVEVDGTFTWVFDPTDANLYSFAVDIPPLSAGRYQARYLVRHLLDGEPQGDYVAVGEALSFTVQGCVPATGLVGRLMLVLVLTLSGTLLLSRRAA